MAEKRFFSSDNNATITILTVLILLQFHVFSVFCDLHGFSPQKMSPDEQKDVGSGGGGGGGSRSGEWFYKSITKGFKLPDRDGGGGGGGGVGKFSKTGEILTREIKIKQGKLRGLVKEFKNKKLKNVETFLGIPYAAPPVKSLRFMPPGSPPTWKDVKIFDYFKPVCPQKAPDLNHEPLKTINAGYYNRLKRLMPFLTNQSEDCLYLNVYAPVRDNKYQKKYPVIVYIHGESFEWNSGNPYDGSVLSSYGNVVVVTINFRLGILGFLKPGLNEHTVSNFGLLDQIAGLQWIKDNIGEFGGDSSMVTLMGHGTGAACINFLMVSPVSMASEGLFHKAILMSGTALSDWALTQNPLQFTIQVAESLNCPLVDENDELSNCLRRKRLSDIMSVKVDVPEFQTPFGPIVDGSVVPNTPQQVMGVYQNLFTRYDMLYGMTEWETYHSLDPVSLTYGMLEGERNEHLRKFMYARYEALPYFALATTLSEYLDWRKPVPSIKSAAEEHRDLVLDLLSDVRYSAPVIQMAGYHSKINPKSYLYVFKHKSKMGEFAGVERSVSGEEISYVFGCPLLNEEGSLSHHKFTLTEQLLSESIITYFTNFAKTGNPNAPRRSEYLNLGPKEWQQFDVYWPEYDNNNQNYLALSIPPFVGRHYRTQMMQYWNKILPELLSNPTKVKQQKPEIPFYQKTTTTTTTFPSNNFNNNNDEVKKTNDDKYSWSYDAMKISPNEYQKDNRKSIPFKNRDIYEDDFVQTRDIETPENDDKRTNDDRSHYAWVTSLVGVSVCLLIINAVIISVYYYKQKKRKNSNTKKEKKKNRVTQNGDDDDHVDDDRNECKIKSNTSLENFYPTDGECSTSVMEPDTRENIPKKLRRVLLIDNAAENGSKFKKWLLQTNIYKKKYGNDDDDGDSAGNAAKFKIKTPNKFKSVRKNHQRPSSQPPHPPKKDNFILKPILKNSKIDSFDKKKIEKISVGIDATPSSRPESVLKQIPIELTKSLDRGITFNARTNPEVVDVDAGYDVDDVITDADKPIVKSQTSISLQLLPTSDGKFEPDIIKLEPKVRENSTVNNLKTFSAKENDVIVNVTSRDSRDYDNNDKNSNGKHCVDPLENIQRRNFPKVLPDFPEFISNKRFSFPQPSTNVLYFNESNRNKLHSVPESSLSSSSTCSPAPPPPPPPPPPRVSTLRKKDKQQQQYEEKTKGNETKLSTFTTKDDKLKDSTTTTTMASTSDQNVVVVDNNNETETLHDKNDNNNNFPDGEKLKTTESIIDKSNFNKFDKSLPTKTVKNPGLKPSIIIRSKIGPKKTSQRENNNNDNSGGSSGSSSQTGTKKAHVNLQLNQVEKSKNFPVLDSKGPEGKEEEKENNRKPEVRLRPGYVGNTRQ
ncbi:conserved hypothetical protein [Pediculus humanus corporis]|uniref:Carboxylesterase type B domain-containing protein n=1 Tax=Pediculus humanus subsp. corporis TaxID=121224 RepID=E0VI52_PEDHC|nr:uncharacterized protein Phum_PHUM221090 [Pediculus humanus corporis]EEB13058.1 conserved hypothetical protein [Pediculus humanus corporis]